MDGPKHSTDTPVGPGVRAGYRHFKPRMGGMPAVLQGHEEGSLWDQGKRGDVSCRGWDVVHCKEHFRDGRLPPRRAPCALNRREVNMGACEREGQRERKTKTERVRGGKEEAGGGGKGRRREGGEETGVSQTGRRERAGRVGMRCDLGV